MTDSPDPRRRRVLSFLVRLACFALVPLVIFATPQTASAAVYGTPVSATFENDDGPGADLVCNLTGYWKVTAGVPQILVKGSCETGWLNGVDTMMLEVESETVGGCHLVAATQDLPSPGDFTSTLSLTATSALTYDRDDCFVTTGSVFLVNDQWVGEDRTGTVTFDWALGQPPEAEAGSCEYGTVHSPTVGAQHSTTASGGRVGYSQTISVTIDTVGMTANPQQWRTYYIVRPHTMPTVSQFEGDWVTKDTGTDHYWSILNTVTGYRYHTDENLHTIGAGVIAVPSYDAATAHHFTSPGSTTHYGEVVGVGVIGTVTAGNTDWYKFRQAASGGLLGISDPSICAFYWGPKIADISGTTDNPLGTPADPSAGTDPDPATPGTDPDPDDQSAGCGFDWTDPSTYASAGICKAVGLLGQIIGVLGDILSAIAGLADDIASAIAGAIADAIEAAFGLLTGILSDVFVPSPGYFDGKVAEVRSELDDTQPAKVVDSFTGQDFGVTASGCSGIPVNWSIEGQSYDFNLGEACSGATASAASVVKLAGSAFLVIFGALACLRALGSGFGWNPAIGKGSDA